MKTSNLFNQFERIMTQQRRGIKYERLEKYEIGRYGEP